MNWSHPVAWIFTFFFVFSTAVKLVLDLINYRHRKKHSGIVPPELEGMADPEKLEKINRYSNEKLVFSLVEFFLSQAILIAMLLFQWIPWYYEVLTQVTSQPVLLALLFFGSFYLVNILLAIPFSLYFNFKIEKKYGFNQMTPGLWAADQVKEFLITAILGAILLTPLVFLLYSIHDYWWILVWVFMVLFSLLMQVIYPTVIAPLFNKFKPLENLELKAKIEDLLEKCSFHSKGVFEMDASKRSTHSNAYFTGIGKNKRIVLFDSLLKNHTDEEILSILAHELGHYHYGHVTKGIIFSSAASLAGLGLIHLLLQTGWINEAFFIGKDLYFLGLFMVSVISGVILFFFHPLSSWISRRHEFQADAYALRMMGTGRYLISSLKKLNLDNLSNIYPSRYYVWFYYSHPPLFERIRALNK